MQRIESHTSPFKVKFTQYIIRLIVVAIVSAIQIGGAYGLYAIIFEGSILPVPVGYAMAFLIISNNLNRK